MESQRQNKYNRLLLKDIAEIFQRSYSHSFNGAFITITGVEVTPDLSIARVHISVLAAPDKQAVIDQITDRKSAIRGDLGRKIGKQVRIVPDLVFFLDDTEDNAEKIDSIFDKLDIKPAKDSDQPEN
jgi:ribosome-binding factor A